MNEFELGLGRYWTKAQLAALQAARVGIAGAGGLGSNCVMLLVRSGCKKFVIVDFDRVDASNLNRQLYFSDQVGKLKVEALADNLRRINPDLELEIKTDKLCAENVPCVFHNCQIVVEALDGAEDKAALVTALAGKASIIAASGIAGWGDSDRIKVKKLNDRFFIVGDGVTDVKNEAPYAPRVMVAAAKQADLVLEYILKNVKEESAYET